MAGKAPRRVFVVGVGMTKFEKPGRREGWDYPDMVQEAGTKALRDAGIDYKEVQQAAVGYVYGDSTCGQRAIYQLGLTGIPVYNVNNNCSTGSTALFMARNLVAGGLADCVLAVGFEKMERGSLQAKWTDRTNPLDQHMNVMSETRGITAAPFAPQMFGNAGVEHMERFGSKPEHMAKIAWKNHKHSGLNPYSQFQDEYSLDQILKSPKVFGPLTKLQCCPTSDGAAAAVIASEDFVRSHGLESQAVEIAGMSLATDLGTSFTDKSCIKMVGFDMSKKAAEEAYAQAGIRPTDAQVVELHDCLATDHQILTSDGWLGLVELELLEREQRLPLVASYDQERDALVYRPIEKLIVRPGGRMIELTHHNEAKHWAPDSSPFGSEEKAAPRGQRQDADGRSTDSNHVSLLVTRNHDMLVRLGRASIATRKGDSSEVPRQHCVQHWSMRHGGKFHKVKAAELLTSDPMAGVKFIGAASAGVLPRDDAQEPPFAKLGLHTEAQVNAFLELYGYWLGDGTLSYAGCSGRSGLQFAPVKERDQAFLNDTLALLPLMETYRTPSLGARGEQQFSIYDKPWFQLFDAEYGSKYRASAPAQDPEEASLRLLKEEGGTAPNVKSAKWFCSWVARLSREQLRRIIYGLWLADGSSGEQGVIFTNSIRFRDELQIVLLHAGYSAYFVNEYKAGAKRGVINGLDVVARHHHWRVCYSDANNAHVVLCPSTDIKEVETYTDRVWCVNTAPYHTIVVRRIGTNVVDGRTVVTKASRPVVIGNCFSANELVTYEAIGLARQGEAHKLIDSGDNTYGGKWVVNPSGGLISKGHPLGATGLAQCAELTWQLRRMCGKRQVPNVKYAIQHNIGLGGAAVVSVYRLGFPDKFRPLAADLANPAVDAAAIPRAKAGAAPAGAAKAAPAAAPATAPATPAKASGAGSNFKSAAVFAELAKRAAADPSLVKKVNGVYHFKIQSGSESGSWTVDLKNGNGSVAAGAAEKADCTITMQDQDFVDLITGKLNGQQAFVQGKLKIQGNMALAMKLSLLSAGVPKANL